MEAMYLYVDMLCFFVPLTVSGVSLGTTIAEIGQQLNLARLHACKLACISWLMSIGS